MIKFFECKSATISANRHFYLAQLSFLFRPISNQLSSSAETVPQVILPRRRVAELSVIGLQLPLKNVTGRSKSTVSIAIRVDEKNTIVRGSDTDVRILATPFFVSNRLDGGPRKRKCSNSVRFAIVPQLPRRLQGKRFGGHRDFVVPLNKEHTENKD